MHALPLMPQPRSVRRGEGWLHANGRFRVEWLGQSNALLDRAVARFLDDVARRNGLGGCLEGAARLCIDCRGDDAGYLTLAARERYALTAGGDAVTLTADGPAGVLRGLATLRQSIANVPGGFAVPAMAIDDAPRFPWRGLMIDVARHFMSLAALRRQIDAMELVKLNVLHLHLSDDEGFRVESRLYPRLHECSSPDFYSQAEIRQLVAYAADRGVRIVPELDVPGHSLAIRKAYPAYASGSALDPSNPETFTFLDRLFGEMAALFPDEFFHVGGDEVSANGLATIGELEAAFFERVRKSLAARGKTAVGWEEVARRAIPDDVVVATWRSARAVAEVTARGNRVIATCGWYLDKLWPCESHYRVDPHDPAGCGPTREELEEARAKGLPGLVAEDAVVDPALELSPAQRALVLGGEAALWSEIVSEEMLDGRIWPAAAVVAERLWSPASVRDPEAMYRRLLAVHDGLRSAGLLDEANRRRMAAKLAPARSEPVTLLLDLVSPVRNHAHHRSMVALLHGKAPVPQELRELADAAPADSLVARRFALDVERFVRGRSGAPDLEATLASWRDNHVRFVEVARGTPQLEAALPISADVGALARIGLESLAAIASGRAPDAGWFASAAALLARQAAAEDASATVVRAMTMPQPPADLLIAIAPAVRRLVEDVARLGR